MNLVSEIFPEDGYNFKEVLLSCINNYYNEYKAKVSRGNVVSNREDNIYVQ